MKRYHDSFPAAPKELVAKLAGECSIPNIYGARVGKDGSVYLDVIQDEDFHLSLFEMMDLANFFNVSWSEVTVENGPKDDTVTLTVSSSAYDFSSLFPPVKTLPGIYDSEESIEASAALAALRRG